MNELIENKSWFSKNWKWFIPLITIFLFGMYAISTTKVGVGIVTVAKAYSDPSLYDDALEKVNKNEEIKEMLGELEPMDNLAILEGTTIYSNNNNSVKTSIRIKGNKSKGKLDIVADKNGAVWYYKKISVRIREPKQTILVLEEDRQKTED